ncbi:MAG: MBL fold metallo-hydrolase, partial [Clostridia bacterium]|nr:MBL fold metallo-hydrolase [Clostridia bacterium]
MKIVCLAENTTSRDDVGAEHGLSLYVEAAGKKILFDMGQTDLFMKNAEKLGVDLSKVDVAVLSHGHYDHGGGLSAFLKVN